ncbi:MAG: FAD-dependent thymidylate synthase [Acidobacteriota bacterium]
MTIAVAGTDQFTPEERRALEPHFTNLDGPIFALVNLPEVVKGALFARYSRSPKSLRRLFLDEFLEQGQLEQPTLTPQAGAGRAERLYSTVFSDYGDDSVAQLGGVHLACEDVSNIVTKVLEWGRLMAYLEQSTRYIPYTQKRNGRWRYHVPAELGAHPALRRKFIETLDEGFERYAKWFEPMQQYFRERYPKTPTDSDAVYRAAIRAKALDTLRGMLPAATRSNVGIYATGQAFEALLLRMRAHPLQEVQDTAALMLVELRKVIPAFLTRVDQPERGVRWSKYLSDTRTGADEVAADFLRTTAAEQRQEVTLSEFDPDGEIKVVASILYSSSHLPDDQLMDIARAMDPEERAALLSAYVGDRGNRRHKPGRAFERTRYRFDILADYGAFRDLQRHRMLTLEWQALSTRHGYVEPEAIHAAGALVDWQHVMDSSADLHDALVGEGLRSIAPYAVAMAYRVRFYMDMNAREAMHVIELRTAPQGHPSYRRICQQMHRLIAEQAGHRAIAEAMKFADHSEVELERLKSEREIARKKQKPR